ncbi:MAG: HEPN domain-containing protein [Bryobacterales bacterium]|jgi:HEPN domain-containing protein|nr:HEPN domain-containing protein [Bryobacterales bacterium]
MPPDPEKVIECRGWLDRAWADIDSAVILLGASRPRPDSALFHCQQAVEKSWKALLFWHDTPFRKTHNLRELGEACAGIAGSLMDLAQKAEDLTQFAWVFRYPGEPEVPTLHEARDALSVAREVYEAVLAQLPDEVRPEQ